MRTDRLDSPPPASIAPAADPVSKGFGVVLAIVGSLYLVARPVANQFFYYSQESALAGLLAVCFIVFAGLAALRKKEWRAPDGLMALVVAWIALFVWGALRSPNRGEGVPLATDAIVYALMLLAGYYAGRIEPALRVLFIRVIIAMVAVEAADGLWQSYVGWARLRREIDSGAVVLTDALAAKIGLDRINGDDAQATFGNPNSLAAYLLVGFFLLLGHSWDGLCASVAKLFPRKQGTEAQTNSNAGKLEFAGAFMSLLSVLLGAFFLWALYRTGSKGGGVAFVAGLWFFALQRLTAQGGWLCAYRRWLNLITANGISVVVLLLILCTLGVLSSHLFGLSMEVRFDYWKSALSMIRRHPLDGVGVAGFSDWYSLFKTPMGWEVKDPHNEYVSLFAELGVLGPLIYCAIWKLVLKHSAGNYKAPAPAVHSSRLVNPDFIAVTFGAMALLLTIVAFGAFNSADVFNSLRSDRTTSDLAGAMQTLLLPILFAGVFLLLRAGAKTHTAVSGEHVDTSPALLHGFRAAAGAILMHQLVDFDFKAQAVMVSLFLCGGLFWAAADEARESAAPRENSSSTLANLTRWIAPVFALLLIPTAVWIPLNSGIARKEAEDANQEHLQANQELVRLLAHPLDDYQEQLIREHHLTERLETLPRNALAAWKRAGDYAPYDAAPRVEWAVTKMRTGNRTALSNDEDQILNALLEAEALRPRGPNIKVMLGAIYLRRGMKLAPVSDTRSQKLLDQARGKFAEARALYPLRPSLSLMEGDALLFLAHSEQACERYLAAFTMDIALNDSNVYLSSIFTDPRPGAFVVHDLNFNVAVSVSTLLQREEGAAQKGTRSRMGLLVRHMVGLAQSFQEGLRLSRGTRDEQEELERTKIQLLHTTSALLDIAPEGPMRAHAAFLYALCVKAMHLPRKGVPSLFADVDWKRRCGEANAFARALQEESIKKRQPGTVPRVFDLWIPAGETRGR